MSMFDADEFVDPAKGHPHPLPKAMTASKHRVPPTVELADNWKVVARVHEPPLAHWVVHRDNGQGAAVLLCGNLGRIIEVAEVNLARFDACNACFTAHRDGRHLKWGPV